MDLSEFKHIVILLVGLAAVGIVAWEYWRAGRGNGRGRDDNEDG